MKKGQPRNNQTGTALTKLSATGFTLSALITTLLNKKRAARDKLPSNQFYALLRKASGSTHRLHQPNVRSLFAWSQAELYLKVRRICRSSRFLQSAHVKPL